LNQKGEGGGIKLRRSLNILKKLHEKAIKITSVADPDQGSGIRCLFDPWIRDPGWVKSQDPDPGLTTWIIFPRA
jgi:hypothetical protein